MRRLDDILDPERSYEEKQKNIARGQAAADLAAQIQNRGIGIQEQGLLDLRTAQERARQAIRQKAAKALAYGLSGGTPLTSGANLAAAQQSALDVGAAQGEFDLGAQQAILGQQQSILDQQNEAALADLAASQFAAEAGTEGERRAEALAAANAAVDAAKEKYTGYIYDDPDMYRNEVERIARMQTDPAVAASVRARRDEVRTGWND